MDSSIEQNRQKTLWSADDCDRLRAAFREGGPPAAARAFPDRSRGAVFSALRRYCFGGGDQPPDGKPNLMPRAEVRARLSAIPLDHFAERFELLMHRKIGFLG